MKNFFNQWNWFSRLLFMMVALGGLPVVGLAVLVLFMPAHLSIEEYRQILGVLMMTIPVISLCLAGLASRTIKSSYQKILMAQRQFRSGNFSVRILSTTDRDTNLLFKGFNSMAEVVETMFGKLVQQEKDKVLSRQAVQVAHDIRSPLSSLQTASTMLSAKADTADESIRDALDLLQLSQKRLESIADSLLKKEMKHPAQHEVFSIHEILDELVGEFKASQLGRGVNFVKNYWHSAVYIQGNRTNMQRALGNVVKNALEAMQSKSGLRELQIATKLNEGENVEIRIKDSGIGIGEEKLSKVLGGGFTDGKMDGHGIGTQVLKEVIAAHNGTVEVSSAVNKGTEFLITVPMNVPTISGKYDLEIPYHGGSAITVIDDDPGIREQWRILVKPYGVPFHSFSCWEEISPVVSKGLLAGTVIVDYHFNNSVVDGLEIIRRLSHLKDCRFVLATAEYWKPMIKSATKELNAMLCPKPLPNISLSEGTPAKATLSVTGTAYKILVIDDDAAILLSWKMMMKHLKIGKLDCYKRLEDVPLAEVDLAMYDACFIDKNVNDSQYGAAEMLTVLKERGARWVVLASGETSSELLNDERLSKVDKISKDKIPMSLKSLLSNAN